ncbi:hypothetical protein GB931_11135 [Modestobacter sp. I12A-02628]|uniref:Uncharacterized protein n=1 Tax=Goekera deserti TaxID=2497753 RepID=A0A7K3WC43_9ACTN|nr:hypothetical protein [Goekera deserti]MPQ98460.1 hypothetical protein [Goekera deserti]NDI48289.1 hypothetical protein [Goekera deserti]NEL54038.1 hypothetical protein [Goekera deserti]
MIDQDLRDAMHRDMAYRAADEAIAAARAQVPAVERRLADEIWTLGTLPRGGFSSGSARRAAREVVRGLERQLEVLHEQIELAELTRRTLTRQADEARGRHTPALPAPRHAADDVRQDAVA